MKSLIITVVTALIVLSSCSVYRSGQTPDDVYFSPARQEANAYVQTNNNDRDGRRYNNSTYNGYDDFATAEDRWLMMRVRNRSRWSVFDDYNYYNPYDSWGMGGWGGYQPGISFSYGFYNPFSYSYYNHFNDYYNWNSYYNPYYPKIIVVNPRTNPEGYTRIRNFNLNNYSNTNYNNRRAGVLGNPHVNNPGNQGYNNSNNSNLRNSFRRVFSNSNVNTRNSRDSYRAPSQDRPIRTYSPSNNNSNNSYTPSSSSSNNNSSSGSSGSGSRPSRR